MTRQLGDKVGALNAPLLGLTLETERLWLRPLAGADAPALAEHLADPEVTRWLARVPHPYRLSDAVSFVEQARLSAAAGQALTLGLVPKPGGEPVIGVVVVHGLRSAPEFGYWLARSHWGQGLMGEAAVAMIDAVRGMPRVRRIRSGAFAGNEASLAIQRRNGFRLVGRSHRLCLAEGRMKEHIDTLLEIEDVGAKAPE